MEMDCEDLPGPDFDATFIKEEPESDDDHQYERPSRAATITGIYMNKSSGISPLINTTLCKRESKYNELVGPEESEMKNEPGLSEFNENSSDEESVNGDIDDLDYLPAEEMVFLKRKPNLKKKKRKQSLPKRHKNEVKSLKEEFYKKQVLRESHDAKDESNTNFQNNISIDKNTQHNTPSEVEECREKKLKFKEKRQKRSRKKKELDDAEVKRKRYKQERRLECDYCPELCASQDERDQHIWEEHPGYYGQFICVPCNKDFGGRRQLKMHKNTQHKQSEYSCPECNSKFVNKLSFKRHMLTHTNNPLYVCSYCGKSNFIARADMERHIRSIHTKEKPYLCKYEGCDKRFPSSGCRSKHYVTHTGIRKHECEYCGIKMQRTSDLRQHIRKHTGEKPFQCTICGMAFTRSYRLKMHRLVIHQVNELGEKVERRKLTNEERPHQCETCGKRFCDKTNLQRHYATHTNDRAFVCETCGAAFNFESNLQRHVQTVHLGKFTYNCPTCNMGCRDKDDYERHMAKHTGLRKHSCPTCNKSFYTKDALAGHIRTVHQAIRSTCSVCGSTFKEIRSHQNHMLKVHKMPLEYITNEIEEAKRFKRMQAELQKKPVIEVDEERHSRQIYYNCDICKRDLLSIKSLPKHYMKVHKLRLEEAEARARNEERRKWDTVQQQTSEHTRGTEIHQNSQILPIVVKPDGASLSAEEAVVSKMIPALYTGPDVPTSAFAQAYLISYRNQFGV